jgi:hypothetical protein
MSLYKRFRGTNQSEALKESGTTIDHNTNFYFRTGAAMLRFYQKKRPSATKKKIGILSTQGSVIAGSFSLAK